MSMPHIENTRSLKKFTNSIYKFKRHLCFMVILCLIIISLSWQLNLIGTLTDSDIAVPNKEVIIFVRTYSSLRNKAHYLEMESFLLSRWEICIGCWTTELLFFPRSFGFLASSKWIPWRSQAAVPQSISGNPLIGASAVCQVGPYVLQEITKSTLEYIGAAVNVCCFTQ